MSLMDTINYQNIFHQKKLTTCFQPQIQINILSILLNRRLPRKKLIMVSFTDYANIIVAKFSITLDNLFSINSASMKIKLVISTGYLTVCIAKPSFHCYLLENK